MNVNPTVVFKKFRFICSTYSKHRTTSLIMAAGQWSCFKHILLQILLKSIIRLYKNNRKINYYVSYERYMK